MLASGPPGKDWKAPDWGSITVALPAKDRNYPQTMRRSGLLDIGQWYITRWKKCNGIGEDNSSIFGFISSSTGLDFL